MKSGVAIIASSSVPFAAMAVLTKSISAAVPSAQIVAVRFFIGVLGAGVMFAAARHRPDLRRWRLLLARGFFGGVAVTCYFFAIAQIGAGPATMLNYLSPVYASVFAAVLFKERPGLVLYVGLVLATLGAVLVTAGTGFTALQPSFGALAGLAAGVLGGASMTGVHALRKDTDATTVFFAFCVVGLAVSAPIAAAQWAPLDGTLTWKLLLIGVLSLAAQMLFSHGMGFTTATRGSATTQLTPVVTWAVSALALEEWPRAVTLVGAGLCLAGVLIGLVPRGSHAPPTTDTGRHRTL